MNGNLPPRPARFERQLEAVTRIVARLIECSDPRECERLLLDAVFLLGAARAAAVWRRGNGRWLCVLERGPPESLPSRELVDAVLEGNFSRDVLPAGRAILQAGSGAGALALSLGDTTSDEGSRDVLEALLHVTLTLGGFGSSLRDPEFPARPQDGSDAGTPPDPR